MSQRPQQNLKTTVLLFISLLFFQGLSSQITVEYLIVAGGGGGGYRHAGGGGAGGLIFTSASMNSGTYAVTVGSGGAGSTGGGGGTNGGNSVFNGSTAIGGGGGGDNTIAGKSGGSGGGGSNGTTGGSGTSGQGNKGGNQGTGCCNPYGGGGGGAGAAGANTVNSAGSNGGIGSAYSITGVSKYYAGGGGGGIGDNTTNFYSGGLGGGGKGGLSSSPYTGGNGTANTGGGGGGGGAYNSSSGNGGAGGSGVVIIRYASPTALATGGTITSYTADGTNGTNGVVYQVHTFTSSGNFVLSICISAHPSTAEQNVCVNGTTTALSVTATGTAPYTYQWYSNTTASNSGGTAIAGATSSTYTPPSTSVGKTYYYCYVTNSAPSSAYSAVSGAINVGSMAGTLSGGTTVTSSTNSTTLTTTGSAGSLQWQWSSNNTSFADISGATSASYTATNVTSTTYYRVKATNGSCGSVYSSSVTILYQAAATSGTSASITASAGTTSATNNTATTVDPGITVTSNGNLTGLSVSITSNYTAGDILSYTGSLPTGVTAAAFNTTSRSLVFSGSASAADWQSLLRTVQITTTSATCNPETRQITFSASTNYYNYFNGHFYEYSPTIRSWTAAKAYAESQSFFGRKGYLVTVSSAAENAFIYSLINYDTWIGCSDNSSQINSAVGYTKYANQTAAEGKWHWITGPEKGVQIRTGNASTAEKAGSAVSGIYQNWNMGGSYANNEPNDVWSTGAHGQEDYGHLWGNSGKWNDFPNNGRACIIEYGDMPGDNPVSTLATSKEINVTVPATGTISGGGVSVCNTTNSTALNLTGNAVGSTVTRWESSPDNFLATATSIPSSNSTSYTATNVSETTSYRAVVVNGSCTTVTKPVTITYASIIPGTVVATSSTICENTDAKLTLSGCSGSVSKWQKTTTSGSGYSDIASSASTELTHTLTSAGTYYFRAVVTNAAGCTSQNTSEYTITVSASSTPAGGEVSSNSHCGVNNNGTLVLSGSSGTSYSWEYSTDNGSTWTSASNTTTTFNYTNVSQNRLYRVLVTDGACGSAYSTNGSITIYGTTKCLFTGETSGNWATSSNWCGGVIADNGSDVDISPTCRFDVELDKNRRVGQLTFLYGSKYIKLGNYDLTASSISGNDSLNHIKITGTGVLKMGLVHGSQKTFPIGKSTYNPVAITNKTNQTDTFTTSLIDEVMGKGTCCVALTTPRVKRTWIITKGNGTSNAGDGVDFTFNWYKNERSGTINTYRMYHFNGSNWDKITPVSSAVVDTAYFTHNGYKGSFSPFAMGDEVVLLPVNWQTIACVREENNNTRISWATASETESDSFVVERATTAGEFRRIGAIPASGNSYTTRRYSLMDEQAPATTAFYRIKQTDKQGNGSYSEICQVNAAGNKAETVKIFPNPADNNIYVLLADGAEQGGEIIISDIAGKEVMRKAVQSNQTTVSSEHLTAGLYTVQVITPGKPATTQKILIQHR